MNHARHGRDRRRIVTVLGTRPEAIKLAPVITALNSDERFHAVVVVTAQHRALLDQVLELFEITPDHDLDLMEPDQRLCGFASKALRRLSDALEGIEPDMVVVQGDTTTAMIGALAAFYLHVPVAHVEAGLRTFDKANPFPEEVNRRILTQLADLHFAPTVGNRANLLAEGVADESVIVTGNSGIDALLHVAARLDGAAGKDALGLHFAPGSRIMLMTIHRRESFGAPLEGICSAIEELVHRFPDVVGLIPVHPNPHVRKVVTRRLGQHQRIQLLEPLDYYRFVAAMKASHIIMTDSGGVQEEAPSLGKPILVLRDVTERPEAVTAGAVRLVGRDPEAIVNAASELLSDDAAYLRMTNVVNPYGDGHAAPRMVDAIGRHLLGEVSRSDGMGPDESGLGSFAG